MTVCPQQSWSLAPVDESLVGELAHATGLSATASAILVARGVRTAEEARLFLRPSLQRDWHDPSAIPGMDEAAAAVAEAVRAGRSILVFGDFDLDGVSAAAVATRGLRALGGQVAAMVPRRFGEGYGLSEAAIERALAHRPDLVVTVDCGISSAFEAQILADAGVDLVVTDHHEPGEGLPRGVPVANPKLDQSCPSRDLAGAGVSLKLVQAVGRLLGETDRWTDLADLASLGTIADVVPLTGENRALVAAGVAAMRSTPRVALSALMAVAGVSSATMTAESVAFGMAPRLNAAGRLADAAIALDLLMTDDAFEAEGLAAELDALNRRRQEIEAELASAAGALAERTYEGQRALVLAGEGWHEGVKGIVASRIASRFGVPALLFSVEDGVARGSGRSVGRVDLHGAIERCSDLLERFGGHQAAVGLQLPESRLEQFERRLLDVLDELPAEQFESPLTLDAALPLDEVSVELGLELAQFEPFGHGNPRPLFLTERVFMNARSRVGRGEEHLKFEAFDGVAAVPAIAFRCRDIESLALRDAPVDLASSLEVDEWRGRRRAQLIVRDVRARDLSEEAPAAELVDDLFARADELIAREDYGGIEDADSFHTKLAGVTFEGRQHLVAGLEPGAPLRLERQPDNPHDANACALFDPRGEHIGFLNRRLASVLAPVIDAGVEYDVEVAEVTGGGDGRSLGVNVVVTRRDAASRAVEDAAERARVRAELALLPADALRAELARRFIGDRMLHAAQAVALDHLEAQDSTLAVMATGRGKSLIFHLHAATTALSRGAASVFVYPLRALVADQAFHLEESLAAVGLTVCVLTGESSPSRREEVFAALDSGDVDVVLTTPEFLDFHAKRFAAAGRVGFVVVDEAHHVGLSRAAHRPSYARLGHAVAEMGGPVVLAVTATASDEVADMICSTLGITRRVFDPTVRDNMLVVDERGSGDRDSRLVALVAEGGKSIIYVNSRKKTVELARMLRKRLPEKGGRIAFYNGGLSRPLRHAIERAFRNGELDAVVSTSAFGEGVNIPDVRNVVLYHLPFSEVEFNQMAGRAGRDGAAARVWLLFGTSDRAVNERILAADAPDDETVRDVYRVLRRIATAEGASFEATNAEIAERTIAVRKQRIAQGHTCRDGRPLPRPDIDERSVSTCIGILRELGFVASEGRAAYRRLTVVDPPPDTSLDESVRLREGRDAIEQFALFADWALGAPDVELLRRFNRPILPTSVEAADREGSL